MVNRRICRRAHACAIVLVARSTSVVAWVRVGRSCRPIWRVINIKLDSIRTGTIAVDPLLRGHSQTRLCFRHPSILVDPRPADAKGENLRPQKATYE
jgi:hypothetical protein